MEEPTWSAITQRLNQRALAKQGRRCRCGRAYGKANADNFLGNGYYSVETNEFFVSPVPHTGSGSGMKWSATPQSDGLDCIDGGEGH
jgi:hypothetical protein